MISSSSTLPSWKIQAICPDIATVPDPPKNNNSDELEVTRAKLHDWLIDTLSIPEILSSQFLYQFLCADANTIPPFFEILFPITVDKSFSSTGDLDMDMMYDKIEQAKSTGSFDERDLATLDAGNVDVHKSV